jgi:DNA recombination protein RmuC
MDSALLVIILLLVALAIVLLFLFRNKADNDIPELLTKVNEIQIGLTKIETNLKEDFRINREENTTNAKTNREELNKAIGDFRTEIMTAVKTMTDQNNKALEKLNQTLEQKVTALIDKNDKSFKAFTDGNTTQLEKIENKV